ncbi:MAG: hypothetical protein KGI08_04975 [Thaumarchaeota archaeon]|nr:hypothetical protein [Nitrososphaerota archaeon]
MTTFVGTLFLKLDQKYLSEGFFSNTYGITGTLYLDQNLTTVFNASSYPIGWIRMFRIGSVADYLNKQITWVSQSGGTFQYFPKKGELPPANVYRIKIELQDANPPVNEEISTYPVEFSIIRGPFQ